MTSYMKLSTVQKAFVALIIANMIWGAASPIFKLALQNIPPFTLAFWRFFLGAILLAFVLKLHINIKFTSRRDLMLFILYALTGVTLNIIFYFWGLRLTYAINAPVIASAQPIVTLVLALVFLKETFVLRKFFGMLAGTIGILIIVLEPLLAVGIDGSVIGNIFLVIATLAAVANMIVGKSILPRYNPITFTFGAFMVGAASFLPLAIFEYSTTAGLYPSLDWRGYGGIAFGAILSSAAAYSLYAWGLSKINATDVAMFTYVDPIVGTVLASLLLHEPITLPFLLGAVFIFGGIFIAEGRLHYHPLHLLRGQKQEKEI